VLPTQKPEPRVLSDEERAALKKALDTPARCFTGKMVYDAVSKFSVPELADGVRGNGWEGGQHMATAGVKSFLATQAVQIADRDRENIPRAAAAFGSNNNERNSKTDPHQ
jgi:hypothetical protein